MWHLWTQLIKVVLADGGAYVKLQYDVPQRAEFHQKKSYTTALFDYEREANTGRTTIAVYIPTY
jgi:hypothetical protein